MKVIYHGNCPDGFASALVTFNALGDKAQYIPAYHNSLPNFNVENEDLYFLDFVYPKSVMEGLIAQSKRTVIIDHHAGAEPVYT